MQSSAMYYSTPAGRKIPGVARVGNCGGTGRLGRPGIFHNISVP
jgi:hypothetical protein